MKPQPTNQETAAPVGEIEQEPQQNEQVQTTLLQEMTDLLKRTQANFENYRKQAEKRTEEIRETAARSIILQLLPIIDNLELALKNVPEPTEFVKGIELIYSQLFSILEAQGVEVIMTEKIKFDPYYHEALLKVESDLPGNSILEEFQKGYLLKGQVLRHAKVKISAGRKNHAHAHEQHRTKEQPKIHSMEETKNGD